MSIKIVIPQTLKWLSEQGKAWDFAKRMGLGTCTWDFPFTLWHPKSHKTQKIPRFLFTYRTHGVGTNVGMVLPF